MNKPSTRIYFATPRSNGHESYSVYVKCKWRRDRKRETYDSSISPKLKEDACLEKFLVNWNVMACDYIFNNVFNVDV